MNLPLLHDFSSGRNKTRKVHIIYIVLLLFTDIVYRFRLVAVALNVFTCVQGYLFRITNNIFKLY